MSGEETKGGSVHFLAPPREEDGEVCDCCGARFSLRYAYQQIALRDQTRLACSQACREKILQAWRNPGSSRPLGRRVRRIAVLNQKGGTGKTTTAVNLASGLADRGKRVLLVDLDAQGHVGISLGVKGERSIYHVIVEAMDPRRCVVPVTPNLDVLTASDTLAAAEIYLARMNEGRDRVLRSRMSGVDDYDYVLLDCGPSLSLLNMNALTYVDELLVPVSCDFLSLVGVRQVMKTLRHVNELLLHPVRLMGVLPTFHDLRNRISEESVRSLRAHYPDRVLPPIRVNTKLKEAPSHKQTIFEYAPDSRGAEDYRRVVQWVLESHEGKGGRDVVEAAEG